MSVKVGRKLEWAQNSIEVLRGKNTSGGALVVGDVVVLDTTNSSSTQVCFTTTTTANDKAVLGVLIENVAANGYCAIQTKGPTSVVKVSGTAAISKGSYLSTHNAAGISQAASAGYGGVYAIALEAYSTDNDLGVIDAWLCGAPRVDTAATSALYSSPTFDGDVTINGDAEFGSTYTLTIAGEASATAALTLTAGDLTMTDGHLNVTETDGTTSEVVITHTGGAMASDNATLSLIDGGDIASGGNMLRIAPTGTPNAASILVEIVGSGKTGQAIFVDGDPTGKNLVEFNCGGALTDGYAVLAITNDGNMATGGALVNLNLGGTNHTAARAFEINGDSEDAIAVYIDSDAATESAVQITGGGAVGNDKAMLDITNVGEMVAGSSLVRIYSTAAGAGATVYGLEIAVNATYMEGLYVSAGTSLFAEAVTIGTTAKFYFRDTGLYLYSSADGQLDIIADTTLVFGASGAGTDIIFYGASAGDEVTFDVSDTQWEFDGIDIQLGDADMLELGDASDATLTWDGTTLILDTIADDKVFEIGNAAATQLSWDVKIYGNEANGASYMTFDAGSNCLISTGYDIQLVDADLLNFGTGASVAGDVSIWFDDDADGLQIYPTGSAEGFTIGAAAHVMNTTLTGTFTVGVNDTGYDVKFFGATASMYMLWDEDANSLLTAGGAGIVCGDGGRLFVGVAAIPGTTAASNWIGIEDSGTDPAGTLLNSLAIYTPDAGDSLDFLHADGTTDSLGT